ncbi:heme oxygenase [Lecanosticta acicola]|uniref:Heme oxygenase n=1 Tax=Lecanosticta acicola TaxID=111012 RepID=A0AAI9E888_9PEZI|nr:heme oxygenase [Lecanosticta acicola]
MAARIPTPSLSPPPPPPTMIPQNATLPGRINTATRKQHTELNRLLINRLPLSLPPHQETPLLYSKGIVPFARIFILFEIEWELLTRQVENKPASSSSHDQELREWLANLRPKGLARSHRLRNDLKHLRLVAGPTMFDTPDLGTEWTRKMRSLVRSKPHVFVAFAWVFYMAVFSGGRWIRQQLANAGPEFWTQQASTLQVDKGEQSPLLELPGFSFLSFDGDQDGEDLKALFKTRLADAERIFTEEEKQGVVDIAGELFDRSICLVTELDRRVSRQRILSWIPTILLAVVGVFGLVLGFCWNGGLVRGL